MYHEKMFLTPEEIFNKEFKIDARGYRPQEVDKFLDMIIHDYTEFMNVIKKLEQDNRILIEENNKIKTEYRKLKTNIEASEESSGRSGTNVNNVDLLRRLSNLEKIVYKE